MKVKPSPHLSCGCAGEEFNDTHLGKGPWHSWRGKFHDSFFFFNLFEREGLRAGVGTEGEGEADAPLNGEPSSGFDLRLPRSQCELKSDA